MLTETDLELLSDYLDGALSQSERSALEARLHSDPELQRELARLRATVDLIKMLPPLAAPRDLTLSPRMVRRPNLLLTSTFSAVSAAAAAILLIAGVFLFNAAPATTNQVAFAPTIRQAAQSVPGEAGVLNLPETTQKLSTEQANDLLQAAPTGTEVAAVVQRRAAERAAGGGAVGFCGDPGNRAAESRAGSARCCCGRRLGGSSARADCAADDGCRETDRNARADCHPITERDAIRDLYAESDCHADPADACPRNPAPSASG